MADPLLLYGGRGSGAVAVEAALVLAKIPYRVVDQYGDDGLIVPDAANPLRQVPALVLPSGELLTESAAILMWIAETWPEAGLAPPPGDPRRAAYLRWMAYVSAAIYSLYWIRDDPMRIVSSTAEADLVQDRTAERISLAWSQMEAQLEPGAFLLGDRIGVLDLYVTVVSRFRPRRQAFYAIAPRLGQVVRRVDAEPRLAALWAERYPFFDGWDRV
jgi:GST-like protein